MNVVSRQPVVALRPKPPRSAVEESIGLEDKLLVILVVDTVVCVWEDNHLGIREILGEMQRVDRVYDDLVISAHDKGRLLD